MNDLGFDIDETDFDAHSRGVDVEAARPILLECFTKLVHEALNYHTLQAQARQQPGETHQDYLARVLSGALAPGAPVVPAPAQSGIRNTTGGGKSTAIRQVIAARYIPEAKASKLPHRVLIAVPTHKLAAEARTKMSADITVAIWQGLKATKLDTNEPMCLNHAAVDAALALGADVETTACRRGKRGGPPIVCPFYEGEGQCHYQEQKAEAFAADVLFVAHEGLFQPPPGVCDGFGLVIIDESFWQKGLSGAREDDRPRLAISGLNEELKYFPVRETLVRNGKRERVVSEQMTQELHEITEQLQAALTKMPDGYVQRAALQAAGLGACRRARALEWLRKVDHGVKPDATPQQRDDAVKRFGFLAQIEPRVEMWHAVDELLIGTESATGRLRIETVTTKEGSIRWLYISGRKRIDNRLMRLPIIYADATLPLELTRHYLPRLELALDLVIAEPHGRLIQAIGHPVGKSALQPLPNGKRTPAEEARVGRKRARLADTVRHLTQGRRGLAIVYKDIEKDFEGIDGVETGHFGALEGIDRWGNVAVAVLIGRPMPKPQAVAAMAAALTGRPVVATSERCEREVCGSTIKCWTYSDRDVELVRAATVEAAIEQARGRVRAVNRTSDNPVEVYLILHDVVVPGMPVDEVVDFKALEPDAVDELIARGLVPQFPTDALKLYLDLFRSRSAAKMTYHRAGLTVQLSPCVGEELSQGVKLVTSPYKKILIRRCDQFGVRYRPRGRGSVVRLAWVDPVKVPNIRARLEGALGKLDLFELIGPWPVAVHDEPCLAHTASGLTLRWW